MQRTHNCKLIWQKYYTLYCRCDLCSLYTRSNCPNSPTDRQYQL